MPDSSSEDDRDGEFQGNRFMVNNRNPQTQ